jgi:hypothetical protein
MSSFSCGRSRGAHPGDVTSARESSRWRWPLAPAVFNLSGPAHYLNWHFFHMSVANVVVILLMIAVFIAAILLPFPRGRDADG